LLLEHGFKLLDLNLDGELSKNDLMRSHADGELTLPPKLVEVCSSSRNGNLLRGEFNLCISHAVDCQGLVGADEEGSSHDDINYDDGYESSETGNHGSGSGRGVDVETEQIMSSGATEQAAAVSISTLAYATPRSRLPTLKSYRSRYWRL
jgi:hypothetical protein